MKQLRFLLVPITLGLVLMPHSSVRRTSEVNHFRDVFTDTDPDFCGTGQAVDVEGDVRITDWFSPLTDRS